MADMKQKGIVLMSSTTEVDLAGAAGTETVLYTAPPGYDFIPVMVILDTFSADEHATPPIVTLGIGGGDCDQFLGNQTLNTITANYAEECLILQPIPSATPVTVDRVPAGSAFSLEITQANGAALTCTAHTFGKLRAA